MPETIGASVTKLLKGFGESLGIGGKTLQGTPATTEASTVAAATSPTAGEAVEVSLPVVLASESAPAQPFGGEPRDLDASEVEKMFGPAASVSAPIPTEAVSTDMLGSTGMAMENAPDLSKTLPPDAVPADTGPAEVPDWLKAPPPAGGDDNISVSEAPLRQPHQQFMLHASRVGELKRRGGQEPFSNLSDVELAEVVDHFNAVMEIVLELSQRGEKFTVGKGETAKHLTAIELLQIINIDRSALEQFLIRRR